MESNKKDEKRGMNIGEKKITDNVSEENGAFWTKCPKCATLYKHLWVYLNKILLCRYCGHVFVAQETISHGTSSRKEPAPSHSQLGSSSRMLNSTQAEPVSVVQQAQGKLNGERDVEGFTDSDPRNFKRFKTDGSLMHGPLADKTLSQTGATGSSTPNVDGESQESDDHVRNCLRNFLFSLSQIRAPNAVQEKRPESKKGKGTDLD